MKTMDRMDMAATPEMRAIAISAMEKMLEGKDVIRTVCALLDTSSSFLYGDRARDAGVHYTPRPVATYICRRTISSYLAHQMGSRSLDLLSNDLSLEALHSLYFTILKNIRVLDSSCGSGIFLEAALDELYRLRMLCPRSF